MATIHLKVHDEGPGHADGKRVLGKELGKTVTLYRVTLC
jgi:hypothetical protein